ncbi:hypothetical protein TNCV_3261291 [Trichonephila clavipes]|nr:hypothetical protein TNCV_3261291 [Trichonephila clavipes]
MSNHLLMQFKQQQTLLKRCQDVKETDFHLDYLNPKDKNLLLSTLMKFKPAFSKCIKTLGHIDFVTPKINTIHPHPISSTPYPIPQSLQIHAQNYLEELIAADIIEKKYSKMGFTHGIS